jgi:hypothetical protein
VSVAYYWLENGKPYPVDDIVQFIKEHGDPFSPENIDVRRADRTDFTDGSFVSTVFLVLDHNHRGNGPPVLWETLTDVPGDSDRSDVRERYTSLADAKAGHWRYVDELLAEGRVIKEPECPY